jgi:hypothetical protein
MAALRVTGAASAALVGPDLQLPILSPEGVREISTRSATSAVGKRISYKLFRIAIHVRLASSGRVSRALVDREVGVPGGERGEGQEDQLVKEPVRPAGSGRDA